MNYLHLVYETSCYEFWCCPCFACSTTGDLSVQVAVHHKYGIRGSLFEDILVSCFCACCSWCQMAREITKHNEPPLLSLPGWFPSLHWDSLPLTLLQRLSHWLTGALPCHP
uniref:Uncharacterized protein n=1 Tax=Oncorhynchus mykiss TaxID=8022 RepID=A0A8K9WZ71_ONCMY